MQSSVILEEQLLELNIHALEEREKGHPDNDQIPLKGKLDQQMLCLQQCTIIMHFWG
jgi:hypothetical protein